MRLITWNCRGLGNGPAIRGLLDIQKREAPDILFLCETKHDGKWLDWLRWKLEMTNLVTVDSVRTSGGLALFWRRGIEVEVKSFSKYHIDSVIHFNHGFEWRFTGIYGESKNEEKDNTWETLRLLKDQFEMPWLCSGDFNEILFNFEKEGGHPRAESDMHKFRLVLEDCDLQDLGFLGDPFTWRNNHHMAASFTKERLDRAVANSTWRHLFPMVRVVNGDPRHSDHRPIIIDVGCRENMDCFQQMQVMPKFEAKWLEEEECEIRVREALVKATEDGCNNMMQKQRKILGDLWEWDRNILGDLEKRINKVKCELERWRRMSISQESVNREHLLRYKLERLQDQLNIYWKQRAHNTWLTKGDRNTGFFHAFASKRRRKNWIRSLKDEDGVMVEGDQLKYFIANQYQQLFMSCAGPNSDYVLNCVEPRVTLEMNEILMEPFTGEEIWKALESIGDLKAPGADEGLSAMLQTAEEEGKIEGIKICRGAPRVNHLFFADDSLILMRAKAGDAQLLKHILQVYEDASGQVLKARYFPRSNILQCVPRTGISYTWRSILRGADLLKKGLIWRIGNGENVKIWEDPWIPKGTTRKPVTPRRSCLLTRVCELIDPITGSWDEQLISDIFWPEDAAEILRIPINMHMEDWPAWHFDAKGMFSVKSAYKLAVHERDALTGKDASSLGCTGGCGSEFQWIKIWQIKAPNKVKMFIWRFAHNSLPVRRNLIRHGMKLDTICPVCKRLDEDCGHIFFKCKYVKMCWLLLNMEDIRSELVSCRSGIEVINKIWELEENIQLKVSVFLWRWWSARNKANDGGRIASATEVCGSVSFYLMEFEKLHKTEKKALPDIAECSWKPPGEDIYKINSDGSFDPDKRIGGYGFVIRDMNGEVLAAGAGNISYVSSALHAEAIAAYKSVLHAAQLGMSKIILETDSKVLANTLSSTSLDRSIIGAVVAEIRDILQLEFSFCNVSLCNRSCNKVADSLAVHGAYVLESGSDVLMSQVPPHVMNLVHGDLPKTVV